METSKTLARKGTRRSPILAHETSPVLGASVMGMTSGVCQGQRCMPAGVPGVSTASSKKDRLRLKSRLRGAAGWRLHRGEPEPGNEDKIPPTAVSPKVAWPRQDRQRHRTGVTPATTGLHQLARRSLPHERIRGKRDGICLPDAGPRGKRRFIKCNCQEGTEVGQEITPKTQPRGAGSRPPNL
jgi:hypothetical protein